MENARTRIITAAEELISKNGLEKTTIANIARKASVADSLVYQYFKGKEDLLFSVACARLEEAIELLEEQLQGIRDAESKLRKMVWYGLRYNDHHQHYIRTLLFECRSNKDFYTSAAYGLLRRHAGTLLGILNQGVADGIFRNDIDIRLVRDIIYGTLDFEAISCIATAEIEESVNDFDEIMAMILPMIAFVGRSADQGKRSRILAVAEKLFSKKGFSKATISELAHHAQVAEGTIYEYFKNKEDLLVSIAENRFQKLMDMLPETFEIKTPMRKLRRLIRYHFGHFLTNRDFLRVFLTQIQFNLQFYTSRAFESYRKYFQVIENIIEEGKAEGSFHAKVNARVFRNMFLGAFSHMALRWLIVGSDKGFDKMMEIDRVVDLLSSAVLSTDSSSQHNSFSDL